MGTKAARVDAWNRFLENRRASGAVQDRQWATGFLPKDFSGIYVCAEPPHKSQVATLLNMGLLTLILGRTKNPAPLFHSVFNLLALRILFPNQYRAFHAEVMRRDSSDVLRRRLSAYEVQTGYFSPHPLFVAVGVTGDGLFIDVGDRDFLTSTCKPNQTQIKFPVGAAFTVASTAAALLSANSEDKIQRCVLVSVFPRAVPEHMMESVRSTSVHIGLGLFTWGGLEDDGKGGPVPLSHSPSKSQTWPLPFGSKDAELHLDANRPWRRTKLYLGRHALWTDTYSLSDLGRRSCLEQTVEYTFTLEELEKWRTNIRAKLATGLLDEALLVYCDRFFLKQRNLPISGDSHPLLELFTGTANRPGRNGVEPDGLLETGCAMKSTEFALVKPHINIVSMGWTYFQRRRQAGVQSAPQHAPSTEDAFLDYEKREIELFFAELRPLQDQQQQQQRSSLPLPEAINQLMRVAREVSVSKNDRHWCVVTLRHRGALCVDLLAVERGERCSWALVYLPHVTTVPSYVAQAGDVFRGAFGAAFCAALRDGRQMRSFELLQHCTQEAVWVANKRTAMFSPPAFLSALREPRRRRRVLIVGGGVIGLTTAIRLMSASDIKQRYDVTVLAPSAEQTLSASDRLSAESKGKEEAVTETDAALIGRNPKAMLASSAAASFWMPFRMGGPPTKLTNQQAEWAKATYNKWKELYNADKTRLSALTKGVCLRLRCDVAQLVEEWLPLLVDHLKDQAELKEELVEGRTACRFESYLIESRQFMEELERQFLELGGVRGQLEHPFTSLSSLAQQHPNCYIVNCTGESGCTLSDDSVEMRGVRGDLLHFSIANLEAAGPAVSAPQVVIDEVSDDQLAYVVRHQDTVVLGGTAWTRGEEPTASHNASQRIRENCIALLTTPWKEAVSSHLMPEGGEGKYFAHTVGYRPTRKGGPRVERQDATNLFHNYGHAGSGWSMCWGAADEIAQCMQQYEQQQGKQSSTHEGGSEVEEPLRSAL